MEKLKQKFRSSVEFIKKIDKEYLKEKYHRMRNLNKQDIKAFLKRSRKPIKYAIIIGLIVLILIPIATYLYFVRDLSSKERILNKKNEGVVLLDRNDEPFFTLYDARTKNPVALDALPEYTKYAFISIEDQNFYDHPGFSIEGIGRAIRENLFSDSSLQGGSTISQQLIKNALLSPDRQLLRKYQELVLALELERRYSKDDILELYINTNYYGESAFGIQDAAQRFFSKDASELTLAESALFAGLIRAPSYYSPISGNEEAAYERKDLILELMHEQGHITEEEMIEAQNEEIELNPREEDINEQGVHFALMIKDILIEEYGEQNIAQSGHVVHTTLDLDLQTSAQEAVRNRVNNLRSANVSNGAAVVIDPNTGEVLSLVGSYDWSDEETGRINMAARPRQPGSSFKPIIYAKAFQEELITTSTVIEDEEVSFGNYTPRNYDRTFRGEVLVRYALANSLNIPAVKVMNMVGVSEGIEFAQELGITTLSEDTDYGLPLVLGAAEVPLIEMTNAYAVFANEGEWNEYTLFTEIQDKNGRTVMESDPESDQVINDAIAFLISSILSDEEAREDTFGGALTISRTAAVKTGTTEENRDALTIGYTPQVVVGAWVGNNDNTPMSGITGSVGAGPIWRQVMETALQGQEIENFTRPIGVVSEEICREDGGIVEFATESAYTEFYLRGTSPTELCGIPTPTPTPEEEEEEENEDEDNDDNEEDEDEGAEPTSTPNPTQTPAPTEEPEPTNTPNPDLEDILAPTITEEE